MPLATCGNDRDKWWDICPSKQGHQALTRYRVDNFMPRRGT